MAANTHTASLDAENLSTNTTYQNPNVNPTTSQGTAGVNLGERRLGGASTDPDAGYSATTGTGAAGAGGVGSSIGKEASVTGSDAATQTPSRAANSTVGGGDAPTTHGGGIGQQIKGVFAQGHGVGEVLRGKFNSAVDTMAGDSEGLAEDKTVTTGGEREFANRDFAKKGTTDKAL
ncbi:hypothetical protein CCHL11_00149 [Colletotrichum chlorophyti]|uniref:Uncharacterized protein n=1 Tax=Colletotrichum chlorophyti TaxID=708187 RepID=A0A1Q8RU08_9PEZI|nr:hypothetical protein CCHL11_00149 [Colletotrichum chlorophyti]